MILRLAATTSFLGALLILTLPAYAENSATHPAKDTPIEITADNALEWHRTDQAYIARGNALAKQGDFSVKADLLTAKYDAASGNESSITELIAEGHVEIKSGTSTGLGDKATYNVTEGKAVLTGKNVHVTGDQLNVTAKDHMEYYAKEGRIVAIGRPVVTSGTSTLEADNVTAWVWQSNDPKPATGKGQSLKKAEADGHVIIQTPTETATGSKAFYYGDKNTAELQGTVKIVKGPNTLEGDKAEMDLTTNVSRMIGTDGKAGRVKGVFYPGSTKK